MRKWYVIARNEYRIMTSSFRKLRPYFLYLVAVLLAVYVAYLAPLFVSPIFAITDVPAFFISIAAVAMMQIILVTFFFWFIFFPIANTLKDVQTSQYEIFLSAPVKPSDVMLGRFIGVLPFYSIAITVVTGIFTAFLTPLGMDFLQLAIIVLTFVFTLLSAVWIGTVVAALLRTRLGRSARGRDLGRALSLIIALPVIALMYALMGGGMLDALSNPDASGMVRLLLGLFPSSWGAETMILFAAHPGDLGAVWLDTLLRFGGLILFFLTSLWLGTRLADRALSLETATFTAPRAKPDGVIYRTVRSLGGGGSFGTLLASIFKDYARRMENLSKIGYVVGLLVLVSIFFADAEDAIDALIMGIFIFPFLAGFVVGEVTVRGKENFFIYRKSPYGEGRFVMARLMQSLLVVLPIAAAFAVLSLLRVSQITPLELLAYTGFVVLIIAANVAFALGLFLIMPVFTDKPAELMGNIMILTFTSVFSFIFIFEIFGGTLGLYVLVLFHWMLGIGFLAIGKRRISGIE